MIYFLFKITKKGFFLLHRPHGAEVARRQTWRAELTWRSGPARMRHGVEATWQSGGWRVKGPRVSGPWLEYWGGNAIALNRPPV